MKAEENGAHKLQVTKSFNKEEKGMEKGNSKDDEKDEFPPYLEEGVPTSSEERGAVNTSITTLGERKGILGPKEIEKVTPDPGEEGGRGEVIMDTKRDWELDETHSDHECCNQGGNSFTGQTKTRRSWDKKTEAAQTLGRKDPINSNGPI